jgi:hypothetical protein
MNEEPFQEIHSVLSFPRSMEGSILPTTGDYVKRLRCMITDEIFKALGIPPGSLSRRLFGPLFWLPAQHFARLAAAFDEQVSQFGFAAAAKWAVERFAEGMEVQGAETIPNKEPLLIVSNHPGVFDALAIAANLPRDDLKIVITGIPFTFALPYSTHNHLIYATREPQQRMTVLRKIIRLLEEGHAVLIFPSGGIDPDPATLTGAPYSLKNWSASLEIMLRKAPQTQVLVTIVSGVLNHHFVRSPLVWLRKNRRDRQRVAEFLQIIQQVIWGTRLGLRPWITFSQPLPASQIDRGVGSAERFLPTIITQAHQLMALHQARWRTRSLVNLG